MHIEVFGFCDNDGPTTVRPDAAMWARTSTAALIAVWPNSAIGAHMLGRVATRPDAAVRA